MKKKQKRNEPVKAVVIRNEVIFFKINSKPFQVHSVAGKFESPREGTGDDFHWNSIEKNKQKKTKRIR